MIVCHSPDHKCESQIGWCEGLKIPGKPKMSRNGKILWEMSRIPVAVYFLRIARDHWNLYIEQSLAEKALGREERSLPPICASCFLVPLEKHVFFCFL